MANIRELFGAQKIIPYFNLPSNKGKSITPWNYKQRKHLVIYFFGGADCEECKRTLKEFAGNYPEYRRLNSEVLAIGTDSLESLAGLADELDLPFPVLSDETAEVTNKYTGIDPKTKMPYPSIFIADRYGSLEEKWIVSNVDELPGQEEFLSILHLFELRCPE